MTMNGASTIVVELAENEKAAVSVYTRSRGEVSLQNGGSNVKTTTLKPPDSGDSIEEPKPFCTEIVANEPGPGKLSVSATPGGGSASTDYLVVYVEVFS